jgi:hypothetical protein
MGVQVRLTWSRGTEVVNTETVTINADNIGNFHTVPRFIRHATASVFSPGEPDFNWEYSLLHTTQGTALAGQNLRLGLMRTMVATVTDSGPLHLQSPLLTGSISTELFEDRILLEQQATLFDGFRFEVFYEGIPAITDTAHGGVFVGPAIELSREIVPLSIWNLNEHGIDDITNPENRFYQLSTDFGNTGGVPAFLLGLQHGALSDGWMHLQVGDETNIFRFPLPITLFPIREVRVVQASVDAASWGDHFQFRDSVDDGADPSDWWIDEIFNTAGIAFTVYYGHTLTTQPLDFTHVQAARARNHPQAQLIGGAPNFFVQDLEGILARVGWFSVSQLLGHADAARTFPNQVIDLEIPVWEFAGEAEFVDRPNMHPFNIQVEGSSGSDIGPVPDGVINQIRQTYRLRVIYTRNPGEDPQHVYVDQFIWNNDRPVRPVAGAADDFGFPVNTDWANNGDEIDELALSWSFPTNPAHFMASPFDATHFFAGFHFGRSNALGGQHLRNAFAGLGAIELPRELHILPFVASPTP